MTDRQPYTDWVKSIAKTVRDCLDTKHRVPEEIVEESRLIHEYLYRIGVDEQQCWKTAETYRRSRSKEREAILLMLGINDTAELRRAVANTPPRNHSIAESTTTSSAMTTDRWEWGEQP